MGSSIGESRYTGQNYEGVHSPRYAYSPRQSPTFKEECEPGEKNLVFSEQTKPIVIHAVKIVENLLEDRFFPAVSDSGYCPDTLPLERSATLRRLDSWFGKATMIFKDIMFYRVANRELAQLEREEVILNQQLSAKYNSNPIQYGPVKAVYFKFMTPFLMVHRIAMNIFNWIASMTKTGVIKTLKLMDGIFGSCTKSFKNMVSYLQRVPKLSENENQFADEIDKNPDLATLRLLITESARDIFQSVKADILVRNTLKVLIFASVVFAWIGYVYSSGATLTLSIIGFLATNLVNQLWFSRRMIIDGNVELAEGMKTVLEKWYATFRTKGVELTYLDEKWKLK